MEFVANVSRWRMALIAAMSAIFVVGGIWMVGGFGPPPETRRHSAEWFVFVGWITILLFGLCAATLAVKAAKGGEMLRIGPAGMQAKSWGEQTIPWSDIRDVSVWKHQRQRILLLHLHEPEKFSGKGIKAASASLNRKISGGDLSISLSAADRSLDDALAAIEQFRSR